MKIVLSGPDGTGKSTIVKILAARLASNGPASVTWRRFGFFFARAFNVLGRLKGWSYFEKTPFGRIGYHRYRGVWALIYIILIWLDCKLIICPKWWFHDRARRDESNIIDRFYIDIVADLILSTDQPRTVLWFFDSLLKAHLQESYCFILTCQPEVVVARRPDVSYDKDYFRKESIYQILCRLYDIETLPTDILSAELCVDKIVKTCV